MKRKYLLFIACICFAISLAAALGMGALIAYPWGYNDARVETVIGMGYLYN